MSESPDIHAFPAAKLGAFLRAMEDPEGKGTIDAEREREISRIEERVSSAADEPAQDAEPDDSP
jgi:hypothetical protein